jgi:hypothetical protein
MEFCKAIDKSNKLIRFAHNWNNGMVEMWNNGFKENETQSKYSALIFFFLRGIFYRVKTEKNMAGDHHKRMQDQHFL